MEGVGNAGFAVMGGRDQQQLPNPSAVVVTHINMESPAYHHLMYVLYLKLILINCTVKSLYFQPLVPVIN